MWKILIDRKAQKELDKAPEVVQARFDVWLNAVRVSGVSGLVAIPGFRDHPLQGVWKGARSSSLNYSWRVIYYLEKGTINIFVVRVSSHDYR